MDEPEHGVVGGCGWSEKIFATLLVSDLQVHLISLDYEPTYVCLILSKLQLQL